MKKSIKEALLSLASGLAFIIGASINYEMPISFISVAIYVIGFWLMRKYKEVN